MFVAAAAGARVAKHGNRSVSSKSGSADVLEALGANIMLKPEAVAACIAETGVGFMFAPSHHSAMKHAAPVRRELGVRTIFNILGPLTNPAGAPNQLIGVFHPDLVGIHVRVLQRLGAQHVLVVYGKDGMDEVSLGAATMVGELKDGQIREYEIHPEDFGLSMKSNRGLKVGDALESKEMVLEALRDVEGTPREIVVLNAGTALYAANVAGSIGEGIERARTAIASGAAKRKLEQFVAATQKLAPARDLMPRARRDPRETLFVRRAAARDIPRLAQWNRELIEDERHENAHARADAARRPPACVARGGLPDLRVRGEGRTGRLRAVPRAARVRCTCGISSSPATSAGRGSGGARSRSLRAVVLSARQARAGRGARGTPPALAFWKSVGFGERYLGLQFPAANS